MYLEVVVKARWKLHVDEHIVGDELYELSKASKHKEHADRCKSCTAVVRPCDESFQVVV